MTRDEMQTSCCYALQDKTWVRDPDGNEWEVFVVLEDNLAETAACECGDKVTASSTEIAAADPASPTCCAPGAVEIPHESQLAGTQDGPRVPVSPRPRVSPPFPIAISGWFSS